jgi:hypothetical protein
MIPSNGKFLNGRSRFHDGHRQRANRFGPSDTSARTILTYDADYRKYAAIEIVEICFDRSEEPRLAGSYTLSCSDLRVAVPGAQTPTSRRTFLQAVDPRTPRGRSRLSQKPVKSKDPNVHSETSRK